MLVYTHTDKERCENGSVFVTLDFPFWVFGLLQYVDRSLHSFRVR